MMNKLRKLLKKRKAKKYYLKCVQMYEKRKHESNTTTIAVYPILASYWQNKVKEAWEEYDRI